jgi:WD40 repeat protein
MKFLESNMFLFNKKQCRLAFFLIGVVFVLSLWSSARAVVVGSTSTPSSQTFTIFPSTDTNNTMLGFAKFEDGFKLQDRTTTCTYNNFETVSEVLRLNGGRLTLAQDLTLDSDLTFMTGGIIEGNSRAIILPQKVTDFNFLEKDMAYNFAASIAQTGVLNALDWDVTNKYIASGYAVNAGPELVITYFDGNTLTNTLSVASTVALNALRWHPTLRYLAVGSSTIAGNELIVYEHRTWNGTIPVISGASIASGDITAVVWHPANYVLAATTVGTIITYPAPSGVLGSPVTFTASPTRSFASLSFSPGNNQLVAGAAVNTGTEIMVFSFSGGSLTLTSSAETGLAVNTLDWSPSGSYIAAGLAGGTTNIRVYDASGATIQEVQSARVTESKSVHTVHWDRSGTYLLVSILTGSGPEFELFSFDKTTKKLTPLRALNVAADIRGSRWSRNNNYFAYFIPTLTLRVEETNRLKFAPLIFKDTTLLCNSDVVVTTTLHFQGSCKINGQGKRMYFDPGSTLVVRPGSRLIFEDIELQNIGDFNIRCLTNSAAMTLRNSMLILSRNYTFSLGSILFDEDVVLTGTNKFNYTTRLSSTIASQSMLFLDRGITFSYAPARARQDLLVFQDASSILYLNGCTLHSTRTGLHLTTGKLFLDDKVTVSSEAKFNAESLRLNANLDVRVLSGATLELCGKVRYDS